MRVSSCTAYALLSTAMINILPSGVISNVDDFAVIGRYDLPAPPTATLVNKLILI